MDISTKGTIKNRIGTPLIITDQNVAGIIKGALVNSGYDLITKPIIDAQHFFIGEEIEIFQNKQY